MFRRATALVAAVLTVSASVLVAGSTLAAGVEPPAAPYRAISVAGTSIGSATVDSRTDTITLSPQQQGISLQSSSGPGVSVTPPTGQSLTTGQTFSLATSVGSTRGILSASAASGTATCSSDGGSVTVLEVARDGGGAITTIAFDWSATCSGSDDVAHGQARYDVQAGYAGLSAPFVVNFPSGVVGRTGPTQQVAVTGTGSQAVPVQEVRIVGEDRLAFVLNGDTCTGAAIEDGQSCTVGVAGVPRSQSQREAQLEVVTAAGTFSARLLSTTNVHADAGSFTPADGRLVDTRSGLGGRRGALPAGGTLTVAAGGKFGLPTSGISALVLNVTATGPTASTYLTAYPSGSARPTASHLNVVRGETRANLLTVRSSSAGNVTIYNNAGSTQVIADLVGYYSASTAPGNGSDFHLVARERYFDTRMDPEPLESGFCVRMPASYTSFPEIRGYAVTVTAVGAASAGYLTVQRSYLDDVNRSTVNYPARGAISNSAVVAASYEDFDGDVLPSFAVCNYGRSSVHVIADAVGLYTDLERVEALRFKATASPTRILDSRRALGVPRAFGPRTTQQLTAGSSVAGYDTYALASNLTAVEASADTYLTSWPNFPGATRPGVSDLNVAARRTVATGGVVAVGYSNKVNLYNNAGTVNALLDVGGTFELYPPTPVQWQEQTKTGTKVTGAASLRSATRELPSLSAGQSGAIRAASAAAR